MSRSSPRKSTNCSAACRENAAAPTALFLRAFSTGVKVKARDHVVCDILADIGADNVAAGNPALEELSLEAIVAADPQFLFVVTMGSDEEKALAAFDALLASNPAVDTLTAVQEGRVYVLPARIVPLQAQRPLGRSLQIPAGHPLSGSLRQPGQAMKRHSARWCALAALLAALAAVLCHFAVRGRFGHERAARVGIAARNAGDAAEAGILFHIRMPRAFAAACAARRWPHRACCCKPRWETASPRPAPSV